MTTFHDLLRDRAETHGPRPAILFDDRTLSYTELLTEVERVAAGFQAFGIGPGDSVAIVMDNSLECILAWLASSLVGCTDVPINPQYRGQLLSYLLGDSGATAAICDSGYLPRLAEIADSVPSLRSVIVNGPCPSAPAQWRAIGFEECRAAGGRFAPPDETTERVILYSSGTTGPSKGVIHTQKSCLTLSRYNAEVLGYGPDDRLLNFFPLFHQNARYTGVVPALCAGASIRVQRKLSTSTFWQTCDADGATAFNYLGSVLRMILNVTPANHAAGNHSLRKAFGAGATAAMAQEFEERLGIALVEVYGLTEAPMATVNFASRSPLGSAGRASDLFEVAIFDDSDTLLPTGEVGEIVMRPKCPDAMMLGYLNKDEATVRAWRNLWFHSGDRGRLSAQGDLHFEERQKDSIRRRGENISAWEVESVLDQHEDVAEFRRFRRGGR